jgi:hypothetical protein
LSVAPVWVATGRAFISYEKYHINAGAGDDRAQAATDPRIGRAARSFSIA